METATKSQSANCMTCPQVPKWLCVTTAHLLLPSSKGKARHEHWHLAIKQASSGRHLIRDSLAPAGPPLAYGTLTHGLCHIAQPPTEAHLRALPAPTSRPPQPQEVDCKKFHVLAWVAWASWWGLTVHLYSACYGAPPILQDTVLLKSEPGQAEPSSASHFLY